jgi:hypothetical protein
MKHNKFSEVADMIEHKTFIVNHISIRDERVVACFGQAVEDLTSCYITPSLVYKHDLSEGLLIKALVVKNLHQQNSRTEWRVVSIVATGYLDQEEPVDVKEQVVEEPEVSIEERVKHLFSGMPEECFTSREVCELVLETKGVNVTVRDVLRKLHSLGEICQLRIKTKASNRRGTILWGLNISSFGFTDDEVEDEEVEVYEE